MVRGAVLALPIEGALESGELIPPSEGTQMPRRERHAHRLPSMERGAMLARPTRRATYHRALVERENLFPRRRGNSGAQKGAACS